MMDVAEVTRWILTLSSDSSVCIDDGGLTLVELDPAGQETGAYLEIGGTPTEDDEDGADV